MAKIQNEFGVFDTIVYKENNVEHFVLVHGDISKDSQTLLRIHSECLTGDVFQSNRCDCGLQLKLAMHLVSKKGSGVIIYLRQEGRGIGLENKIKAYILQDQGYDTVDANLHLGFPADSRNYEIVIKILNDLKIRKIRLLTNNPEKVSFLENNGFDVERQSLLVLVQDSFSNYMSAKQKKMGHLL